MAANHFLFKSSISGKLERLGCSVSYCARDMLRLVRWSSKVFKLFFQSLLWPSSGSLESLRSVGLLVSRCFWTWNFIPILKILREAPEQFSSVGSWEMPLLTFVAAYAKSSFAFLYKMMIIIVKKIDTFFFNCQTYCIEPQPRSGCHREKLVDFDSLIVMPNLGWIFLASHICLLDGSVNRVWRFFCL